MINPNYPIVAYAPTDKEVKAIDATLARYANKLPNDLKFGWGVKPETQQVKKGDKTEEVKIGYALYALKTQNGGPALDGEVVKDASADFDAQSFRGQEVSMTMNSEAHANGRVSPVPISANQSPSSSTARYTPHPQSTPLSMADAPPSPATSPSKKPKTLPTSSRPAR